MEFTNLTPFSTLNYLGYDTDDQEYEVVTICVEYKLIPSDDNIEGIEHFKQIQTVYTAEPNDVDPIDLCMADEFYDEPNTSSILQESDIIPYKPKCDVLVQGHAYTSKPAKAFKASIALYRQDDEDQSKLTEVMNKELWFTGSRQWKRVGSDKTVDFELFSRKYELTDTEITQKVPLRYEYAFGGHCQIIHSEEAKAKDKRLEDYHEACYRNPIGRGWFEQSYFTKLKQYKYSLPEFLPIPQIMPSGVVYDAPIMTEQRGAITTQQMAEIDYGSEPAGFSSLHRSWSPRLALAGTYDDDWLENRHPNYPKDFDFGYWNSAPSDQQIEFPDLTKPHMLVVNNLSKGGGYQAIQLPMHRFLAKVKLTTAILPIPLQLDTISFHTDSLTLKLVWRMAVLSSLESSSIQLEYITNPVAPWVDYTKTSKGENI